MGGWGVRHGTQAGEPAPKNTGNNPKPRFSWGFLRFSFVFSGFSFVFSGFSFVFFYFNYKKTLQN